MGASPVHRAVDPRATPRRGVGRAAPVQAAPPGERALVEVWVWGVCGVHGLVQGGWVCLVRQGEQERIQQGSAPASSARPLRQRALQAALGMLSEPSRVRVYLPWEAEAELRSVAERFPQHQLEWVPRLYDNTRGRSPLGTGCAGTPVGRSPSGPGEPGTPKGRSPGCTAMRLYALASAAARGQERVHGSD
ncbi:MAG: hypothetical protein K6T35_04130 [Meiothermus silvanus]|nr:hypothetical protein [Allomeiothermus silvanus]